MIDNLKKVYELTLQLEELFQKPITPKNREETIDKLNELIEERGKWMEQISPPYTEEERALGEKIYQMNIGIEENMQQIFTELKQEMKQMKKQKKSHQSYQNPYQHVSVSDGTFLDKKN
jgi:flagellar protein FliT